MFDFKLPDVGEGLTEAEISKWLVSENSTVTVNEILVEVETAKSLVELPAPVAGTVTKIHVNEGTAVDVGTVIVSIDDGTASTLEDQETGDPKEDETEEEPLVLVGTGPRPAEERRVRLSKRSTPSVNLSTPEDNTLSLDAMPPPTRAKPPVRLLAKRLGVNINDLTPSSGDIISRDDVEHAASSLSTARGTNADQTVAPSAEETRTPIKGVRKATAAAVSQSAFTAPHVTEFLSIDMTRSMELLADLKADRAWSAVRLTPLSIVARALIITISQYPQINACWDEDAQEIVQPAYVNLGLAAATPRGLIVPNIKEANRLTLRGLATSIEHLVNTAREGKTSPQHMQRGTITITNIGALGVDSGTPIINPGESAILALGNIRDMPWAVNGELAVRKITQLALTFDHRLVDGELGSNVLTTLGQLLEDPARAFSLL